MSERKKPWPGDSFRARVALVVIALIGWAIVIGVLVYKKIPTPYEVKSPADQPISENPRLV